MFNYIQKDNLDRDKALISGDNKFSAVLQVDDATRIEDILPSKHQHNILLFVLFICIMFIYALI